MKKKTKKRSLKKWFYDKILNRYLIEFHPQFILFADNLSVQTDNFSVTEKRAAKEYKRIMKILNSQKYKRYFYNAVKYTTTQGTAPFKPFENTLVEKIKKFVAKQYLRFFNKKLYRSLQMFRVTAVKFKQIDSQIDDYMKNTTIEQRIKRAIDVGMIQENNYKDGNEVTDRTNKVYQHYLSEA